MQYTEQEKSRIKRHLIFNFKQTKTMKTTAIFLISFLAICSLYAQPMEEIDLHEAPTFNSIDDALKAAEKVHRLDLSGKKLKELPESIKKLVNLQELKLDGNDLKILPEFISELKHLEILSLTANPGIDLEKSFPVIAKIETLRELWLRENKIKSVPNNIELLAKNSNLELLHLGSNLIKTLPESLGKLKSLKYLDVEMNFQLEKLPVSIGELKELRTLDLEENSLTEVPLEITKLKNLYDLDLQSNKLTKLPEGMSKMKSLKHLNLSGNPIHLLPTDLGAFPSLEILELNSSVIMSFDPFTYEEKEEEIRIDIDWNKTIKQLSEINTLKELMLDRNHLTELPASVADMKHLERLELEGNPIDEYHKNQIKRWLPNVRIVF
jgi:Leucine-rich repeat (LRR) protein